MAIIASAEDEIVLLLLFKDRDLGFGVKGFPLVTQSFTVDEHRKASEYIPDDISPSDPPPQQLSLPVVVAHEPLAQITQQETQDLPDGSCVWGWWKKPWEKNDLLLKRLALLTTAKKEVPVLLYNQYLRIAFKAFLLNVYYVPGACRVELPHKWQHRCPEYYRAKPHLCGAFFALRIDIPPSQRWGNAPEDLFKDYYIDDLSFPVLRNDFHSVISVPENIKPICHNLIDKLPTPQLLKASEHTMFALRKVARKDSTEAWLREAKSDSDLSASFRRTDPSDINEILKTSNKASWTTLFERPNTLKTISSRLGKSIVPFDLKLVSWLFAHSDLLDEFGTDPNSKGREFQSLLLQWSVEVVPKKRRHFAAGIFTSAWSLMQHRYHLSDISDYFRRLPILEDIAYSTQYGIAHKFYRDHLNHNVRSALLAAYLTETSINHDKSLPNYTLVAFLSGLFHDIAHPLASCERINDALREALSRLGVPVHEGTWTVLKSDSKFRQTLCLIALLSSIPNLLSLQQEQALLPWLDRDSIIEHVEPRLLFEEMGACLCSDHAILSAGVILYAALKSSTDNFEKTILRNSSGSDKTREGQEFIHVLQSIALHDRRGASHLHGSAVEQAKIPVPLNIAHYPLPTLLMITDELQEWGRPIADIDEPIVADCNVSFSNTELNVVYNINVQPKVIGETSYSLLEHLVAKVRNLGQLTSSENVPFDFKLKAHLSDKVSVSNCDVQGGRLAFKHRPAIMWPFESGDCPMSLDHTANRIFLALIQPKTDSGAGTSIVRDFLVLDLGGAITAAKRRILSYDNLIEYIEIDAVAKKFILRCNSYILTGKIKRYYFEMLEQNTTVVKTTIDLEYSSLTGLLEIEVTAIDEIPSYVEAVSVPKDLHLKPFPHFLDLDWRFSFEAIQGILEFVKEHASNGSVCYLGCPSLAIYHSKFTDITVDYMLLDKGHHAIAKWRDDLIPSDRVIVYDVHGRVPKEHRRKYAIVIMDPPWYEMEYRLFWYRALELVNSNGIIGIAEYPGYDYNKLEMLENERRKIVEETGQHGHFASVEISYVAPPFEVSWDEQKSFTHKAFSAYRPAFMDFYNVKKKKGKMLDNDIPVEPWLPKILPLSNGDYLRCIDDIENEFKSGNLRCCMKRHRSLKKDDIQKVLPSVVGWSTRNALVLRDATGKVIQDTKDIVALVEEFEDAEENFFT